MMKQRMNILTGGAILAAGAAIVGGAFTAGGLQDNSNDNFIGGTDSLTIVGATMENIDYAITAGDLDSITITFASATTTLLGRSVSVELYDNQATPVQLELYSCTTINGTDQSTCTPDGTKATATDIETVFFTVEN